MCVLCAAKAARCSLYVCVCIWLVFAVVLSIACLILKLSLFVYVSHNFLTVSTFNVSDIFGVSVCMESTNIVLALSHSIAQIMVRVLSVRASSVVEAYIDLP